MPAYTLKYFDFRARGEITRLLFASQGIPFKDERFTMESWPAMKQKTKFGQLPVLEVDGGKFLTESLAIANYVARELGLYGSTSYEAYQIDQIVAICIDLFDKFVTQFWEKNPKQKEELANTLRSDKVPRYIGNIEELVRGKERGFSIGKKLSYGDLAIFNIVDEKITDEQLKKFPSVLAIVNNVRSHPNVKKYLAQRKKTAF